MKNIAIFGANGGIGKAFIEYYLSVPEIQRIFAFSRAPIALDDKRLISVSLDVTNEHSLENGLAIIEEQKLDRVVVAVGTLHTEDRMPEKQLTELSMQHFEEVFRINTYVPALIMKYIKPYLNKKERTVIGLLSARVGSISDNKLGGWYAYRASKAALNMLIKTTAIEFKRSHKHTVIIGLHPGTVDTKLSKPYQGKLVPGQLFSAEHAVKLMANVIEKTHTEQSGQCLAYDGSVVPE